MLSAAFFDLHALSAMTGRQLPFFSLIVPFWLVWAMAGRKAMWEVWPACLTSGLSFALTQFLVSNYHGPWVVDIAGAIVSMGATVVLLKFWQPKKTWSFAHENHAERAAEAANRLRQVWRVRVSPKGAAVGFVEWNRGGS